MSEKIAWLLTVICSIYNICWYSPGYLQFSIVQCYVQYSIFKDKCWCNNGTGCKSLDLLGVQWEVTKTMCLLHGPGTIPEFKTCGKISLIHAHFKIYFWNWITVTLIFSWPTRNFLPKFIIFLDISRNKLGWAAQHSIFPIGSDALI